MKETLDKTHRPLLIIDLEATCWESRHTPDGSPQSVDNMEIIEIGCVLANRSGEVFDTQSFLVRPSRYPVLSRFCTDLTSITQSMVDAAPGFPEAIVAMNAWLGELPDDFIWSSWGNYDRLHLEAQSLLYGAQPTILDRPHLNLKRIWRRTTGKKKSNGLANALAFHDLAFEGSHRRGVDDARNIARLLPFIDWSIEAEILSTSDTEPSKSQAHGLHFISPEDEQLMDESLNDIEGWTE